MHGLCAGFMQPVLQDAEKLQEMFMSLTQNETEANVWVNRVMNSAVQTVAKVHAETF